MSKNLTDHFISDLYKLNQSDIPSHIITQVKRCLIDYIGVTLVGTTMDVEKTKELFELSGETDETISIFGMNKKVNIYTAILVNGLNAHKADFDDGVNSGIIHLASPIISAILPVAQKEKLTGTDVIKGIVVGYETALRLAECIQPSHKENGYHASATCGSIGAAIGIAAMLNFTLEQFKNTFSAAATSAYGTLKVLEDGSELKPFNVAKAALNGYIAANMGRVGFIGPNNVLEGEKGFLSMMATKYNLSKLQFQKEDKYAVEKIYFKPHAACRYCHPSIDAALNIRYKNEISIPDIESIRIHTYKWAVKNHDHINIEGITSAKMSIPYSVAAALIRGKADIHEFTFEQISNEQIASLTKKVKVQVHEELTHLFPSKSGAIVVLKTKNGEFVNRVDIPKGEPENPLTNEELEAKFKSLTSFSKMQENHAQKIIDHIWNLEKDFLQLIKLL